MNHRGTETQRNHLTEKIIGAAIEVHRELGPGLLESAYEECLCYELSLLRLRFQRQVPLPVIYKEIKLTRRIQTAIKRVLSPRRWTCSRWSCMPAGFKPSTRSFCSIRAFPVRCSHCRALCRRTSATRQAAPSGSAWLSGGDSKYRVLRGGSWNIDANFLRSADRLWGNPDFRDVDIGFRLAAVARL